MMEGADERAYVSGCTRSALMTARYPFKTGLQHINTLMPGTSAKIPRDTTTIAEVLRQVCARACV
jgi:arylsulfatase A-like enzyme